MRDSCAAPSLTTILVVFLLLAPSVARANQRPIFSLPSGAIFSQQSPSSNGRRDSVKNGALIGAILGAAALSGFGLFLCHALDDTGGNPDCFPRLFGIAALGAGIGVGAGMAIDVLLDRHAAPTARVRLRF